MVDLIHPTRLEWMLFGREGGVRKGVGSLSITYGTKDCFAGPTIFWRIDHGKLILFKNESDEYEQLTLLSLTSSTLIARRRSGEIARYKVLEHGGLAPK